MSGSSRERGFVVREVEGHVAALQQVIRERLDELRAVPPDSREYVPAARRVLDATEALISYEEQLPVIVDEEPRRLSALAVRWAGIATAAVAALLLVAAVLPGPVPWPWAVLLVPLLALGARLAFLPVHPPGGPHLRQRQGAILVAAGLPFAILACTGLLPSWTAVATVLLTGFGAARLLADPARPGGPQDVPTPPTGVPEVSP